jgi:HTH-type transcriptional regulator / antitoxin MqsA
MSNNPRKYPESIISAESGRKMTRGNKLVTFQIEGRKFRYMQPGWWCSLTDPNDMEGQMVDEDNQVAELARRTAKKIIEGEPTFVPVVIRAIRLSCGLSQREAGRLFGSGEKSFEKYESGEIQPSEPTRQLLRLAMQEPELFKKLRVAKDADLVRTALRASKLDHLYEPLFET